VALIAHGARARIPASMKKAGMLPGLFHCPAGAAPQARILSAAGRAPTIQRRQILTSHAGNGMRHGRLIVLVVAVAALFASAAADAAEIEIPPRRAPADVQVQQAPANCSRWTDECVNCARGAGGKPPACSNIGVACQPRAIRCLSPAVPQSERAKK